MQNVLENGNHTLKLNGIRDFYNSPIKDTLLIFNVDIQEIEDQQLFITNYRIVNNYKIDILFNSNLDTVTALNKNNYTFSPNNNVKEITFINIGSNGVRITSEKPFGSIGKEFILSIRDVFSSKETGYLPISKSSGSQIIITSNSENLDDIYVYPNPVRVEVNQHLTFANLTKSAEIYVFSYDGKFIIKLIENDGNGGYDWDLRDGNGELISSGIYIYKAIAKDEFGEELETKTGKFAVNTLKK